MGIKDLYKFLSTKHPECFISTNFSSYRYKCLAIDMMNLLYIHKARNFREPKGWMKSIILFLVKLQNEYVHPICIFDGKSHPMKRQTIQKRRDDREKGLQNVINLQKSLEKYKSTKEIDESLKSFIDIKPEFISQLGNSILVNRIEEHLQKQQHNYSLFFTHEEINGIKEFISNMGINVIDAKYDGEALCSYLNKIGKVDAVITNDSDAFFFGCNNVICKFIDDGGLLVNINHLLEKLEITHEQFIDLCILCGTDFNESMKGCGFVRSLALIQKYKNLDNPDLLEKITISKEVIHSVRNISLLYDKECIDDYYSFNYNRQPNIHNINMLLFKNQINIPLELFVYKYNTDIQILEDIENKMNFAD